MEEQDIRSHSLNEIIEAILNGTCTKEQSQQLVQLGPEAIQIAVLAATQAVMMSVYQTLKLRGLNPLDTIVAALTQYMKTGQLPPLLDKTAANQ